VASVVDSPLGRASDDVIRCAAFVFPAVTAAFEIRRLSELAPAGRIKVVDKTFEVQRY
jgi:hypothetical protein